MSIEYMNLVYMAIAIIGAVGLVVGFTWLKKKSSILISG